MGVVPPFTPNVAVTTSDLTWWANRPFAIYPAVSTALTATVYSPVVWGTSSVSRDLVHSTSVNPDRVYLNTAGWYEVMVLAVFSAGTTGYRRAVVQVSGTDAIVSQMNPTPSGSLSWAFCGYVRCTAPAQDYLTVQAYTSAGTGLTVTTSARLSITFSGV